MEALAAVGLASNIVQFISFARDVVSIEQQINGAAGGLVTNLELEAIARNLKLLSSDLAVEEEPSSLSPSEDQALRAGITNAVQEAFHRPNPKDHFLWENVTGVLLRVLPQPAAAAVNQRIRDSILAAINSTLRDREEKPQDVLEHQRKLRRRINIAVDEATRSGASSAEERELRVLCKGCQDVAGELLETIESLKFKGKVGKHWTSFRSALNTVMKASTVAELEARLDRYQKAINITMLASLRQRISEAEATRSVREARMSEQLLGFIDDTKGWQAHLIETIYQKNWQPNNTGDAEQFAYCLKVGAGLDAQQLGRQRIHQSLRFEEISDRQETIVEAFKETFQWVYHQDHNACTLQASRRTSLTAQPKAQYNNFAEWLRSDEQLYWITGKPGSGKSTLMRYLAADNVTETRLHAQKWSGKNNLIIAPYFFWNSGTKMQMSKLGLMQTLLYHCLQGRDALVPALFPDRWNNYTLFGADVRPWQSSELVSAFSALFKIPNQSLLLFIDGLDEFEDSSSDIVALIQSWTGLSPTNLKICASSRPWLVFEESFSGVPWLRMEDLTKGDIYRYVSKNMEESPAWRSLQSYMPDETNKIVVEIADRAVGVFLWVTLVVSSLLHGLRDGDTLKDLWLRLNELPSRLEALFQKILSSLNPEYFVQACELFQLVLTSFSQPTLLEMVFALTGKKVALEASVGRPSEKELTYYGEMMRRRITSRCKGLVEIPKFSTDGESSKIEFLHRTVRDFFRSPEAWEYIRSGAPNYDAPLLLAASSLQMAKITPIAYRAHVFDDFWRAAASCILYSKKCEENSGSAPIDILEELEKTSLIYWNFKPLSKSIEHQSWMSDLVDATTTRTVPRSLLLANEIRSHSQSKTDIPWPNTIHMSDIPTLYPVTHLQSLLQDWALSSFFDMMFVAQVKSYIAVKLSEQTARSYGITNTYVKEPVRLLVLSINKHDYPMAVMLVELGADPNTRYNEQQTTWSQLLNIARSEKETTTSKDLIKAINVFISHGADVLQLRDQDIVGILSELNPEMLQDIKTRREHMRRRAATKYLSVEEPQKQASAVPGFRMNIRRKFKSWSAS